MIHCFGEILVDIFKSGDKETPLPGGAPYNVAVAASKFGGDVSFYGAVGDDDYGRQLLDDAKSRGFKSLNIAIHEGKKTTAAVVTLENGERSFAFHREGTDCLIDQKALLDAIKEGDIVHFGSLLLSDDYGYSLFLDTVKKAKERGARISFDVNYRSFLYKDEKVAKERTLKAIALADILKMSEDELLFLTGIKDIEEGAKCFERDDLLFAITLGAGGSFYSYHKMRGFVASKKITPVDTTGAGDCFWAYLLYDVSKGDTLDSEESLISLFSVSNASGALATLKKGGVSSIPSLSELKDFLEDSSLLFHLEKFASML